MSQFVWEPPHPAALACFEIRLWLVSGELYLLWAVHSAAAAPIGFGAWGSGCAALAHKHKFPLCGCLLLSRVQEPLSCCLCLYACRCPSVRAGRAGVCAGGRPGSRPGRHKWHWPTSCTPWRLLLAVFCTLCLRHMQAAAATQCGPKSVQNSQTGSALLCVRAGRFNCSSACCRCSANRCRPCCSRGLLLAS